MIKGEAELTILGKTGLGKCLDLGVQEKKGIGSYGCHPKEYRGGSQGIIWKVRLPFFHWSRILVIF